LSDTSVETCIAGVVAGWQLCESGVIASYSFVFGTDGKTEPVPMGEWGISANVTDSMGAYRPERLVGRDPRVNASRPKTRGAAPPTLSGAQAPALSSSAVVCGMNGVKPKVHECFGRFHVPGIAMIQVVIDNAGKVSSATAVGKFAATPTGACVERAVKSATFPPSPGLEIPYPFRLE
jgi:hypothetical protein